MVLGKNSPKISTMIVIMTVDKNAASPTLSMPKRCDSMASIGMVISVVKPTSAMLLPTSRVPMNSLGFSKNCAMSRPRREPLFLRSSTTSLFALRKAISVPLNRAERSRKVMMAVASISVRLRPPSGKIRSGAVVKALTDEPTKVRGCRG